MPAKNTQFKHLLVSGAVVLALLASLAGCSREHYRVAADGDAYSILAEKANCTPWQVPMDYSVDPSPLSRFYDPSCPSDPLLPAAAPQLYAYDLPLPDAEWDAPPADALDQMASNQALGHRGSRGDVRLLPPVAPLSGAEPALGLWPSRGLGRRGHGRPGDLALGAAYGLVEDRGWASRSTRSGRALPETAKYPVQQASYQANPLPQTLEPNGVHTVPVPPNSASESTSNTELKIQPLPVDAWESIPSSCKRRMFEFASVREEYVRTYGEEPPASTMDHSPRLALEDIVYLASINSREYQSQKETLYRVALRLSLERYSYALKFATSNNGTAANYSHTNVDGISQSGLTVPSALQVDKVLATGGEALARVANNVVLTFNGPQGFAADVTTDLLVDVTQRLTQRDVLFESLTQAERNVVYTARDYARFRKSLFEQLAADYYGLLRTYRQVDIQSQNYFSLVRSLDQRDAEFRAGQRSPIEVDQVEQQVLGGRSSLIRNCNSLEGALDRLKIRIGLPTETPINLDLSELESITQSDELAVRGDLINRVRTRLLTERNAAQDGNREPNRSVLLASSVMLIDRMLGVLALRGDTGDEVLDVPGLRVRRARLRVDVARSEFMDQQAASSILESSSRDQAVGPEAANAAPLPNGGDAASVTVMFQRTLELTDSLRNLARSQQELIRLLDLDADARSRYQSQATTADAEYSAFDQMLTEGMQRSDQIPKMLERARQLQQTWSQIVKQGDVLIGAPAEQPTREQEMAKTLEEVDTLLEESERMLASNVGGLVPIEIDVDDAMLTALVLRLDLMNERGLLADDWRAIKLAADELKSVLDFRASQSLSSRQSLSNPGNTTVDSTLTRVQFSFDAPLNRRSERNTFRQRLIDYQAALRGLMQLEDNTKLSVRNDLRDLSLAREQFHINVASAALAYERVTSTELSLQLGLNVNTRDYLEAQQAYTDALSQVASQHFTYITGRTQLFLDTELMTVDEDGFWHDLNNEALQPAPFYQLPSHALPAYGDLPCGVWYSKHVQRMYEVPTGISMIHREPEDVDAEWVSPQDLPPLPE